MERVNSSDVLDPTHESKRHFRGLVIGYFRRVGPNAWDEYQFVRTTAPEPTGTLALASSSVPNDPSQTVDIHPGVPLQLEAQGAQVRVRSSGRVVRLRWLADPAELEHLRDDAGPGAIRRYFVATYLSAIENGAVVGAAAVMVRKLNDS